MPEFTVNPQRLDPYKAFRFKVKWDGMYVPGVARVSPLRRSTAVIDSREGGDTDTDRRSPGRTSWDPITLERGRTHDSSFEDWANLVFGPQGQMSLKNLRKELTIELENEEGQTVMAFHVYRAWPSAYIAIGELDATSESTLTETLVLEHEGWQRDTAVTEPAET
jgi:phage tail-like protein